ncbi:MAG: HlyD family efflux transporter periplasmic adaptor subunit [Pirellulaceae bacterium]|nr:HlyD family efflux transporter periplasmic adaptor subunit [Pirellulaceae bacterium]
MSRVDQSPQIEVSDGVWQEIDTLLEDLAALAKSECAASEFHAECLRRVVAGLDAAGGIVWVRTPSGTIMADARIVPPALKWPQNEPDAGHTGLVASVLAQGDGRLVPPGATALAGGQNTTEFLLVLSPWTIGSEAAGVLEVFQSPGASPKAQRGYLEFLHVVGELVAEFHRQRQLRNYRLWATDLRRLQRFSEQVHRSLDLEETACTIANEVRQLAACDRVSVLVRQASGCRLLAVSGVATVNRRANAVRQLERLAERVCVSGRTLWYPDDRDNLPPELDQVLQSHIDEAHAKTVAVVPIRPSADDPETGPGEPQAEPVGVLVVERFQGVLDEPLRWQVTAVRGHCGLALQRARELDRVPLLRLFRALARSGWFARGRRLTIGLALAAVLVAGLALAIIPADFRIEARGELQPVRVRDVFAPSDGVVAELRARHRQQVAAGEVLAVLRRAELDLQFKQVWGELQTARKRFTSVETERMQNQRDTAEQRQRYGRLTAEQEELREQIAGLEAQQAILEQQQAELEVRSPMDGEVLTWNPQSLLEARPVARGQILLTIGDLAGPWQLELRVPDRRVAHVLAARQRAGDALPVSFLLASDPARTHRGELDRVGLRTEISERDGAFVLATVTLDREQIRPLVPGAGVTAKIHCGRRSLGYVWFHDLLDAVRRWILF